MPPGPGPFPGHQQAPAHAHPGAFGFPQQPRSNGKAIGGLICSALGLVGILMLIPGLVLGTTGLLLSLSAAGAAKRGEADGAAVAKAGTICGTTALAGTLVFWTIMTIVKWRQWFP
ncbi:hypothetical protein [Actinokineospora bangkokensis]|uniref:hypothetical protein n=1 Tax=Actinokineospora bangkokensis TaxID=1193682 RepID=UPI00096AE6BE|nr:hypothetical protein [Actinokineospora bangkokensis]